MLNFAIKLEPDMIEKHAIPQNLQEETLFAAEKKNMTISVTKTFWGQYFSYIIAKKNSSFCKNIEFQKMAQIGVVLAYRSWNFNALSETKS